MSEVQWPQRAAELRAQGFDATEGARRLAALWGDGRLASSVDAKALLRLGESLEYAQVGAGRRLIGQHEAGDFMLVLLEGQVLIERAGAVHGQAPIRLAEARAGDVLGEMALLDGGTRLSACTTATPCVLGVLRAAALEALVRDDPRLALALMTSLARRLSLRLRHVSTRLSALLSDA
jgi:CRP-like cAMP-binding protein